MILKGVLYNCLDVRKKDFVSAFKVFSLGIGSDDGLNIELLFNIHILLQGDFDFVGLLLD